ncbi:MAG: ACT domain-containing protein [Thermacetogeniaceae bacterium]
MTVKQLSVFLENKCGRLAEVTRVLGENGINIRAFSIADTTDFGVLRLIVNRPQDAYDALKKEGFTVSLTDVIAVQIPDRPGGLADVLALIQDAGVNIEYLYAFVGKVSQDALAVFRLENPRVAIKLLEEKGLKLLSEEEVYNL